MNINIRKSLTPLGDSKGDLLLYFFPALLLVCFVPGPGKKRIHVSTFHLLEQRNEKGKFVDLKMEDLLINLVSVEVMSWRWNKPAKASAANQAIVISLIVDISQSLLCMSQIFLSGVLFINLLMFTFTFSELR